MGSAREQADGRGRGRKGEYHRWLKKSTNRLIRRKAKQDPENAPRKIREITRGYET